MIRSLVAAILIAVLALASATAAQSAVALSSEEKTSLEHAVAKSERAMLAPDARVMLEMMPPGLLEEISDEFSVSVKELRPAMINMMQDSYSAIDLHLFDIAENQATAWALSDGTVFVRMPTETELTAPDGPTLRYESETLAILVEGEWYLTGPDEPEDQARFRRAYPQFADVDLVLEKVTVLNETGEQ